MSQKGLYQPKIADVHIRRLYRIAKRQGVTMTMLLNLIVTTALEELDHTGDVCDEAPVARTVVEGPTGGIHHTRTAGHAYLG